MKLILMVLVCALLAAGQSIQTAHADFETLEIELATLVAQSELIVAGTITEVLDKTVTVSVSKVLAGEWKEKTLSYLQYPRKFEIACCPSWDLYKADQEFVLFLKTMPPDDPDKTGAQFYNAANLGRGEMPVFGEVAYTRHINVGTPIKEYHLQNRTHYCSEVNLSELIEAVSVLRECFTLNSDGSIEPACTDEELARAAEKSELLKYAIEHTTEPQGAKK